MRNSYSNWFFSFPSQSFTFSPDVIKMWVFTLMINTLFGRYAYEVFNQLIEVDSPQKRLVWCRSLTQESELGMVSLCTKYSSIDSYYLLVEYIWLPNVSQMLKRAALATLRYLSGFSRVKVHWWRGFDLCTMREACSRRNKRFSLSLTFTGCFC